MNPGPPLKISAFLIWCLVTLIWGGGHLQVAAVPLPGGDLKRTRLIVLPFRNLGADPNAKQQVMPLVYKELGKTIFSPVPPEEVLNSLRRNRIRDTGQINTNDADTLSRELNSPWILLGSIDYYNNKEKIEAGFSARLLNSQTDEIVWAEACYSTGDEHSGLLGIGAIDSVGRLAALEILELFQSLRKLTVQDPGRINTYQKPNVPVPGMVIIPFDNAAGEPRLNQIFDNILLCALVKRGLRIIEPGMMNEKLTAHETVLNGQVDFNTLHTLADAFDADYFLTGYLSKCQNLTQSNADVIPTLEIEARIIEPVAGKVIWARQVEHSGSDYTKIFHLGTIYSSGKLLERAAEELLDNFPVEVQAGRERQ